MTVTCVNRDLIATLRSSERIMPLFQIMAHSLHALTTLKHPYPPMETMRVDNPWAARWDCVLETCEYHLPHGSGFDDDPKLDRIRTRKNRIVFFGSYHQMDQNGSYKEWINYNVMVRPDFMHAIDISVTGGNNEFKDYCGHCYAEALCQPYDLNPMLIHAITAEG